MMAAKGHGLRDVKGPHKKIHVKAKCEKCHHEETVSIYEDQIESEDFKIKYFGCPECQKIFCVKCANGEAEPECPFCKKLKPKDIRPFDIYVMAVFFKRWLNEEGPVEEWETLWRI